MISIIPSNICTGCGACFSVCPLKCISMKRDEDGFLYPKINNETCTQCQKCLKTCPVNQRCTPNKNISAYAAINNNTKTRISSSSGGFFSLIAEHILDNDGVVFGVSFGTDMNVQHICIDSKDDLDKIKGSKYVQSSIGNTYLKAKEYLDKGRLVLFSGTPCQTEGLIKFLGKKYDNLITQDFICHGVPSPAVWKKYLEWQQTEECSAVIGASFRNKNHGWKNFSMRLEFDNGTQKLYTLNQDLFLRCFLKDLCLRPSCYNCKFKTVEHSSDLTLADFWGINNVVPDFDDDLGVSLVMLNSPKASDFFNSIKKNITFVPVDINEALKYNSAATKSVLEPSSGKAFMSEIKTEDFKKIVNKYAPPKTESNSFISKIIKKLNIFLKK